MTDLFVPDSDWRSTSELEISGEELDGAERFVVHLWACQQLLTGFLVSKSLYKDDWRNLVDSVLDKDRLRRVGMSRSDRDSMVGVWGADKRRTNAYKFYMSKRMEQWESGRDDRVRWEKHQEAFNKRFTAEDATTRLRLEESLVRVASKVRDPTGHTPHLIYQMVLLHADDSLSRISHFNYFLSNHTNRFMANTYPALQDRVKFLGQKPLKSAVAPVSSPTTTPSIPPQNAIPPSSSPKLTPSILPQNAIPPSSSPKLTPSVLPQNAIPPSSSPKLTPSVLPQNAMAPPSSPKSTPSIPPQNTIASPSSPAITPPSIPYFSEDHPPSPTPYLPGYVSPTPIQQTESLEASTPEHDRDGELPVAPPKSLPQAEVSVLMKRKYKRRSAHDAMFIQPSRPSPQAHNNLTCQDAISVGTASIVIEDQMGSDDKMVWQPGPGDTRDHQSRLHLIQDFVRTIHGSHEWYGNSEDTIAPIAMAIPANCVGKRDTHHGYVLHEDYHTAFKYASHKVQIHRLPNFAYDFGDLLSTYQQGAIETRAGEIPCFKGPPFEAAMAVLNRDLVSGGVDTIRKRDPMQAQRLQQKTSGIFLHDGSSASPWRCASFGARELLVLVDSPFSVESVQDIIPTEPLDLTLLVVVAPTAVLGSELAKACTNQLLDQPILERGLMYLIWRNEVLEIPPGYAYKTYSIHPSVVLWRSAIPSPPEQSLEIWLKQSRGLTNDQMCDAAALLDSICQALPSCGLAEPAVAQTLRSGLSTSGNK